MNTQSSYEFIVSESKEVGVLISSSDNSDFSLSAIYSYKDQYGTVFVNGADATIDGHNVYCLITPTIPSSGQIVEFTITIIPLLGGVPDPNKNMQIIKPIIYIDVFPDK